MAPDGVRAQPFIMPDGRKLGAFLEEDGQRAGADAGRRRGSAKAKKAASQKWERSFRVNGSSAVPSTGAQVSDADDMELEAISRVGRERRRRWLNDKILRDMAGAMTAADMSTLFKPPPFGGPAARPTVLSSAALPQNVAIWDLFRNIDMEKQHRVLEKWTEHVAAKRAGAGPGGAPQTSSPALKALQGWARTSRKAREALRRASLDVVHALEHRLLQLLLPASNGAAAPDLNECTSPTLSTPNAQPAAATAAVPVLHGAAAELPDSPAGTAATARHAISRGSSPPPAVSGHVGLPASHRPAARSPPPAELHLQLPDGFHRLLVHGLAQFHGLHSVSRDASAADCSPTRGPAVLGATSPEVEAGTMAAESDTAARITVVRRPPQEALHSPDEEVITVSDVLLVMSQHPQEGLTSSMLVIPGTPVSEF